MAFRKENSLPGFNLTFGVTSLYLTLLVLLPLAMVFARVGGMSWQEFTAAVSGPRALAAYKLTLGASLLAALVNVFFGTIVAWVLVRYSFPGKKILDALVDLPFALPTAVAGISLTMLFSEHGVFGKHLLSLGVKVAFAPAGVFVALLFVGVPFVIRTVQPVLADFDPELEEAAATLGAGHWQTFRRVLLPALWPSILTGFSLAFARGLGEYGSVIFISANIPYKTEIVPQLIMTRLENFDYQGAAALALIMLLISFLIMFGINLLQSHFEKAKAGT